MKTPYEQRLTALVEELPIRHIDRHLLAVDSEQLQPAAELMPLWLPEDWRASRGRRWVPKKHVEYVPYLVLGERDQPADERRVSHRILLLGRVASERVTEAPPFEFCALPLDEMRAHDWWRNSQMHLRCKTEVYTPGRIEVARALPAAHLQYPAAHLESYPADMPVPELWENGFHSAPAQTAPIAPGVGSMLEVAAHAVRLGIAFQCRDIGGAARNDLIALENGMTAAEANRKYITEF